MPSPKIPSDWIKHIFIEGAEYPKAYVLHRAHKGSYDPFVTHISYFIKNKWVYEVGHYYQTIEKALEGFNERTKHIHHQPINLSPFDKLSIAHLGS
jgi:hypothetical protein